MQRMDPTMRWAGLMAGGSMLGVSVLGFPGLLLGAWLAFWLGWYIKKWEEEMKVIKSFWFTSGEMVGIVITKNDLGEMEARIGKAVAEDRKVNEDYVADRGSVVSPIHLIDILRELSKGVIK